MLSGGKLKGMPLILLVPVLLIFLTGGVMGQDGRNESDQGHNSLVKGSRSFQFRISPDFTLSAFDGAMISAKKHFSPNSALRFGIGLDARIGRLEEDQMDRDFTDLDIDATIQYIYYPSPQSAINFYSGSGPIVEFQRYKENAEYEDDSDAGYSYTRSWSVGLLGSWGVEWFADENISFICEYGAGIRYASIRGENHLGISGRDQSSHEVSFFSQGVDLGLSVYF